MVKIRKPRTVKPTVSDMGFHLGLKLAAFPSAGQKYIIKQNSDASRFMYNRLVALGKRQYALKQAIIQLRALQQHLGQPVFNDQFATLEQQLITLKTQLNNPTLTKNQYKWLQQNKQLDSLMFNTAKRAYQAAWNLFRQVHRAGTPNFHKKSYTQRYQTARLGHNVYIVDKKHVRLPKIGVIRVQRIPDWALRDDIVISTVSIKMDATGAYSIGFQLNSDNPIKTLWTDKQDKGPLGIDLNTENFLTDSDDNTVDNPRFYRQNLKRLKKAQRKLSLRAHRAKQECRPLRTAKNYQKQRLLVAQMQRHVFNQRQNFLQQLSTTLLKNHELVVAEELRSKNLLKNHAMAMSIQDVGWRSFLDMLQYKAQLQGRTVILVNPKNTTQCCHDCGFIMGTGTSHKLTLKNRDWTCPNCGTYHIRDHNAALNILAKGLA